MCPRKSLLNLFEPQKPLDEENKRALEGNKRRINRKYAKILLSRYKNNGSIIFEV